MTPAKRKCLTFVISNPASVDVRRIVRDYRGCPYFVAHTFGGDILAQGKSIRNVIEVLQRQGHSSEVFVAVGTKADLRHLLEPERERAIRGIVWQIEQFRQSGDDDAILQIRRAVRRTGRKPGPQTKAVTKRRMIGILKRLSERQLLKQAIKETDMPLDQATRSEWTTLQRYCQDVKRWWTASGERPLSQCSTDKSFQTFFRKFCALNLPRDRKAMRQALARVGVDVTSIP